MADGSKLFLPTQPDDPALVEQLYALCCAAAEAAGGYLVNHPDDHTTVVVFGAHQFEVRVTQKR